MITLIVIIKSYIYIYVYVCIYIYIYTYMYTPGTEAGTRATRGFAAAASARALTFRNSCEPYVENGAA